MSTDRIKVRRVGGRWIVSWWQTVTSPRLELVLVARKTHPEALRFAIDMVERRARIKRASKTFADVA